MSGIFVAVALAALSVPLFFEGTITALRAKADEVERWQDAEGRRRFSLRLRQALLLLWAVLLVWVAAPVYVFAAGEGLSSHLDHGSSPWPIYYLLFLPPIAAGFALYRAGQMSQR